MPFFQRLSPHELLTIRSPQSFIFKCVDIALRLAVLGKITRSIEVIEIAHKYGILELRYLYTCGLYFAWEAAGSWASMVPEEHRQESYLNDLDESETMSKWGQILPDFYHDNPTLKLEKKGLDRLLEYIHGDRTQRFTYAFSEEDYMLLERAGALSMAVDFALRLGGHDEQVRDLMSMIAEDLEANFQNIAKSRSAWVLLKDGILEDEKRKAENEAEFERLKISLVERLEKGAQRPFRNETMAELVHLLDQNTIAHDDDEDTDGYELEELRLQLFRGKRSILHEPASPAAITSLEQALEVQLPQHYKEFLEVSNGLEGIWNGYFRQGHLGSTEKVQRSENIWGDSPLPLQLVNWTELPFDVEWPELDLDHAISIHDPSDELNTWLVKPELTKKAVEAFCGVFDGLDDGTQAVADRIISDYFGSMQEFREMEWCVLTWTHWGITIDAWKSFREFMERLVVESGMQW